MSVASNQCCSFNQCKIKPVSNLFTKLMNGTKSGPGPMNLLHGMRKPQIFNSNRTVDINQCENLVRSWVKSKKEQSKYVQTIICMK